MATGFDGAANVLKQWQQGEMQGYEADKAKLALHQLQMQDLENALLQPTRLANQMAAGYQAINLVRPDVVNPPTPPETGAQGALTTETRRTLNENEFKQAIANKYGDGDFEKAKAYLKNKGFKPGSAEFRKLMQDATDSYNKLNNNGPIRPGSQSVQPDRGGAMITTEDLSRAPAGVHVDPVAAAIAKARAAEVAAPPVAAAPAQPVVAPQPVLTMNDLRVMSPAAVAQYYPNAVRTAASETVSATPLEGPNPFSPEGQMARLKPALNGMITGAELELMKGEQQNEFLATKLLADQAMQKRMHEEKLASEQAQAAANLEQDWAKHQDEMAAKLLGLEVTNEDSKRDANKRNQRTGKPDKDLWRSVEKDIRDFNNKVWNMAGRKKAEDPKVLKQLVDVYRSTEPFPDLRAKFERAYAQPLDNARKLIPDAFGEKTTTTPGDVKKGPHMRGGKIENFTDDEFKFYAGLRATILSNKEKFKQKTLEQFRQSLRMRKIPPAKIEQYVNDFRPYFKDGN